ncbi:hypothetical protein [Hyphomicrobium facile]|uniref:Uncharacterized protein n=1 Tax=Hyphomicrobium facile TaxID=51670 RepID=A0A1I7NBY5_9HYPH|nr:hypothetical protein [Hyphomicrobium facile]SFV32188.1 hypothetical protein SAMN04488557_1510 [Hyphomicrobium facile]
MAEEAATQPAPAAEAAEVVQAVVAVVQAEVGAAADREGVRRAVNSVKADLRAAAAPEAANVFVVENGFAAVNIFEVENDFAAANVFAAENGFETTARAAVMAAASGTEGGILTA